MIVDNCGNTVAMHMALSGNTNHLTNNWYHESIMTNNRGNTVAMLVAYNDHTHIDHLN